ncbi:hypothetical protein ACTWP5_18375 [Streptomyces sp. 4N509B]|uniref:hypothetical protein n=1 Tax=Streptomyces sp. 4N509B TaxID=3457413 RepID=UPI003FD00E41
MAASNSPGDAPRDRQGNQGKTPATAHTSPGNPGEMPSQVRTARVLSFAASGLVLLTGLLYTGLALGDPDEVERTYGVESEALGVLGVIMLAHGGSGVGLALRYSTGGSGIRVGSLVWGGLAVAIGLGTVPLGLVTVVLGTLAVWNLTRAPSRTWFERPRL